MQIGEDGCNNNKKKKLSKKLKAKEIKKRKNSYASP